MSRLYSLALLVTTTLALATSAAAQESKLQLPTDPSLWINGAPINLESLRGKAVVLYFFEESCVQCREKWPELAALTQHVADKPVIFLAVSSGTQRGEMEQYARRWNVPWPIILDPLRQLEKQADVGEISLQNIIQHAYVKADGSLHRGQWNDAAGTVTRALAGAAWRVEPADVPPTLKATWQALEMGNFAAAAPGIKKAVNDRKPDVKAAGEKLQAAAEESLTKDIAAARNANSKWDTYKALRAITERYKGFELPEDVKDEGRMLHADAEIKRELAAMNALETLQKGLQSNSPSVRKRNAERFDKLIADHAGTEAASLAAEFKIKAGL